MCASDTFLSRIMYFGSALLPSLIVDKEHESKLYPVSKHLSFLIEETGYLHIQATKPDTVGEYSID